MGLMVVAISVASLASVGGLLYLLCLPPPSNTFLANASWLSHTSVAAAIIPLAVVLALLLGVSASMLVGSMKSSVNGLTDTLPPQLIQLVNGVRPVDANVTFSDVQCIALLLLLAYGSVLVCRHLIDLQRLMKLSRRRILQPEMEELRRADSSHTRAAGNKGKSR